MIHQFEAPFVFHTSIPNHSQIQHLVLSTIQKQLDSNDYDLAPGGAKTSYNRSFTLPTKEVENAILWLPYNMMLNEKTFTPSPVKTVCSSMWWNVYSPGDYARPHNHNKSDFSGIYIVSMNEMNKTNFHSTPPCYNLPWNVETYSTGKLKEGTVMIFPSSLMHSVDPCKEERIVISFNLTCYDG